jgi:hypothetical protein
MELDAIQPAASHKTPLAAQNNLNINWELLMIAADASRVSEFSRRELAVNIRRELLTLSL